MMSIPSVKTIILIPNPKFSLLLFSLKAPSFSHVLLHPFPRMRLDPLSRQDALFFFLELVIYGWMKLVRLYVLMLKKTLFCWAQGFSLVSSPWEPKLEDLKVNECLHFSMFCCYEFIQGMKMVMWWNWGEGVGSWMRDFDWLSYDVWFALEFCPFPYSWN